ncbi:MAG: hypothetical protein VB070_01660 [Clostridiaceae bacterium]|nr:hypothetical protein [Clostridiaceae bacterium]
MKNIAVFTDLLYPIAAANGACIREVSKVLEGKGYDVHYFCYYPENGTENITEKVHYIDPAPFLKGRGATRTIFKKLRSMLIIPFYPIGYPEQAFRYKRCFDEINKVVHFDLIISVLQPVEAAYACCLLRRKQKDIGLVLYELDSITDTFQAAGWRRHLYFLRPLWEKYFYKKIDHVIKLSEHRPFYLQKAYRAFQNKFVYTGVPSLTRLQITDDNAVPDKEGISLIYTGTLRKDFFSPEPILKMLPHACESERMHLSLFARGDCDQIIRDSTAYKQNLISINGFIPYEMMLKKIQQSDCCISIGNRYETLIPSKIFTYMSLGKPIVHFFESDTDAALKYLNRYEKALLLRKNDDPLVAAEKFISFIRECKKKPPISYDEIAVRFKENTPEYTANIIEEFFE